MWGEASDVLCVGSFPWSPDGATNLVSQCRISLRATETSGLFNFVVGGKNINHSLLSNDQDLLRRSFAENTGQRADLKFGDIPWISHYTWVCIST